MLAVRSFVRGCRCVDALGPAMRIASSIPSRQMRNRCG
ncbi:hypothetical protein A7982_12138 [Minicystis rosea]|nr:hypothetical protein A7982_12138 [Minicystis rosea]